MKKPKSRPTAIHLHKISRQLEVVYDKQAFFLSLEYLRISSPSAEVRGHASGEERLQAHKAGVGISKIIPVGHYAIQLIFDDGHDSGIYSWEYLKYLIDNEDILWDEYLKKLSDEGLSRYPDEQVLHFQSD